MNANTAARLSERTLLCLVLALSWGTQACAAVRVKANAPAIAKEETTRKSSGVQQVHRAPAVLSLADAVFLGLRKNNSIRSAYVDRVAQKFDLLVAENQFSPRGSLNGEASHSVLGSLTTDTVSLGPSLNAVTPLGTSFNFVWDNTATRTGTASTIASAVSIGVVQPLLRGAGTDVNLAPVRSAELGEDVSRLHLRATVAQAITDIIAAYRELVRSRLSQKLAEDSAARAQALIDIDQNLILAGRMARMEIVQAQADLEGQKLLVLQSKSQVEAARLALAVLLDIELEAPIGVDEALNPMQSTIVLQQAITIALRRRPDYLAQKDAIEQARLGIVVAENQRLWDLSLVGSGRLGRQYSSAAFARSSRTTIADGSAGVSLSVPINDPTIEQGAVHASASLQDATIRLAVVRQGLEQQIRGSANDINLRWQQVGVARRAEALAASAVNIERQKLNAGRSTTFQVQSLEASYRAAQSQRLNSEIDYANALSTFDLQLGTTLDTWKISLRDQ